MAPRWVLIESPRCSSRVVRPLRAFLVCRRRTNRAKRESVAFRLRVGGGGSKPLPLFSGPIGAMVVDAPDWSNLAASAGNEDYGGLQ
jgi:hypothetical protein